MNKKYLLLFLFTAVCSSQSTAATLTLSLSGTDPISVVVSNSTENAEAGSVGFYVYFRDDGVTECSVGNINSTPITDGFLWGTAYETKSLITGTWLKGGHTFTRRVTYMNVDNSISPDDYWPIGSITIATIDFDPVGNGHVYLEALGPAAFLYWDLVGVHDINIPNQDVTLPVELSAFSAIMENGRVLLKWTTESERDNLGFNIMRAEEKEGVYKKINGRLIEGVGNSTTRTEYQYYDDRDIHVNTTYYYKLQDLDINGGSRMNGPVDVFVDRVFIPDQFYLNQNHPNPFNPSTAIQYGLPEAANVRVEVYNLRGELVRVLQNSGQSAGAYELIWDGRNSNGQTVPSGVYLYRLSAGNFIETRKMLFTK